MHRISTAMIAAALDVTEIELAERVVLDQPQVILRGEPGGICTTLELIPRGLHLTSVHLTLRDVARLLAEGAGQRATELLAEALEGEAPMPASGF